MNLIQLKYFNAVCKYGTVSEAAKYLNISQPSLSNAVKELENEFGTSLFVRRHSGMVLTDEGELLRKLSCDLLGRADEIENIMKGMGTERKTLRLAVPPMIGSLVIPKLYREFLDNNFDINMQIIEGGYRELLQKTDYFDMALLPHDMPLPGELLSMEAAQAEMVFITSQENEISGNICVTPHDIANIPLVLYEDSFLQTEEIKAWFAPSEIKPNIILQTRQLSTMMSMISHKLASGFGFEAMAESSKDLTCIKLESPPKLKISLAWKKSGYVSSAMKRFKKYVLSSELF